MKTIPRLFDKMKFFKKKEKRKDDNFDSRGYDSGHAAKGGAYVSSNGYQHAGYRQPSGSSPHDQYASGGGTSGHRTSRFRPMATRSSAAIVVNLPAPVLERIFTFVCPHTTDETYETCEQSSLEDACMLCDLRDLAHCVAVCKKWRAEALKLLYHSIRIDTVHYCEREIYLSERRKRRSFFDRNAEPEDTTQARLKLLCRTLREDPARLGPKVQFLKTPYMLRESCQADLARTIAVLPNLKYVDLPEGLFTDDPSFLTLRLEVQARCHGIRKMTYMGGAERSLQMLAGGAIWTRLEVLDLIKVNLDPTLMRQVLASLGNLRALKVSETQSFTDEVLYWNDLLPMVPPLEEFILTDVPYVTADGLKQWLMLPEAQQALKVLTLNRTGVKPWTLHEVVAATPALNHLSIIDTVTATMPAAAGTHNVPPLASMSIQTLHYEITPSAFPSAITTASYYNYLASSLLSGGLPNLCAVYVRDTNFPDTLLGLPPPMPSFADRGIVRPASSGSSSPFSSRFSSQSLSPAFAPVSPQGFLSGGGHSPPFAPPPLQAPHNPFLSPSDGRRSPGQNNRPGQGRSPPSPSPPNQWQPGHHPRFSSNNPFASMVSGAPPPPAPQQQQSIANLPHMLEVFTKGDDEIDWSFVKVNPGSALGPVGGHHRHQSGAGSARRPSSSYGLGTDVMGGSAGGWNAGSGARRSIFVGGAGGGFLEVPTGDSGGGGGGGAGRRRAAGSGSVSSGGEGEELWPRPKSSAGEKKWEGMDLWR